MGYQVVGPTPTPTANPTAQIIYVTVTPVPAPVSFFTPSTSYGTAPLVVTFTDQSTNNPTSWLWSFGDGATSTQQNPMHAYNNPGSYTASLTVTNAGGSNTNSNLITVNAAPTAQVIYVTPVPTPAPTANPTSTGSSVIITAFNLNLDYKSTTGYFGPESQVLSTPTFYTDKGNTFTYTLTLTSSALMYDHTVDSISITTPGFTLESVTPNVPSGKISPDSSMAFSLKIKTPSSDYTGPLNILISTS